MFHSYLIVTVPLLRYKFFAPHSGALFGRAELLETLPVDKLDCSDDRLPCDANGGMSRWEVWHPSCIAPCRRDVAYSYMHFI